jgi:hypothetical protein
VASVVCEPRARKTQNALACEPPPTVREAWRDLTPPGVGRPRPGAPLVGLKGYVAGGVKRDAQGRSVFRVPRSCQVSREAYWGSRSSFELLRDEER